nr:hypothetical protein GCM10020063_089960 [Dactylosporangium thailandense]
MGYSPAGVRAAQQVVRHHLPTLTGERCSACRDVFPCVFRSAADRTLNAYGLLPTRVPGATLRAAGVDLRARRWARADHNSCGWLVNPRQCASSVSGEG